MAVRRKSTKNVAKRSVSRSKSTQSKSKSSKSTAKARSTAKRKPEASRSRQSVTKGSKPSNKAGSAAKSKALAAPANKVATVATAKRKERAEASAQATRAPTASDKNKTSGKNVEAAISSPAREKISTSKQTDKTLQPMTERPEMNNRPEPKAAPANASAAPKAVKPVAADRTQSAAPARPAGPARQDAAKAPAPKVGFKLSEFVVYPAHGVGQIVALEEQEVAGFRLELYVIAFAKDKMTLRVPTSKVAGVGLRKVSDADTARRSLDILAGRARIKRTMWSRRAQEYESKINSGDIGAIAEVIRDLYRSDAQPEQSYSERQLYEAALDRLVREIAAVHKSNEIDALKVVEAQLQKGNGRAKAAAAAGDAGETSDPSEAEIGEAA